MKRFISVICIYIIAVLLVVLPPEIYKMETNTHMGNVAGGEVRAAVTSSKTKTDKKIKKLILGDSTGHALYPSESSYDSIVSLACNQAITMGGHYFLLKNYLETNLDNLPEEIIILFTPGTFNNDVDIYAYQYFLKPFPVLKYKSLYTRHLYDRIKSIPLYWTANLPFIQTSSYTPSRAVPADEEFSNMTELSMEYLLKIYSIAKEYNIPICMRSTPVRDDRKEWIGIVSKDLLEACSTVMKEEMEAYVESIPFYPSEWFFDDVHLKGEYTPNDYLDRLN